MHRLSSAQRPFIDYSGLKPIPQALQGTRGTRAVAARSLSPLALRCRRSHLRMLRAQDRLYPPFRLSLQGLREKAQPQATSTRQAVHGCILSQSTWRHPIMGKGKLAPCPASHFCRRRKPPAVVFHGAATRNSVRKEDTGQHHRLHPGKIAVFTLTYSMFFPCYLRRASPNHMPYPYHICSSFPSQPVAGLLHSMVLGDRQAGRHYEYLGGKVCR